MYKKILSLGLVFVLIFSCFALSVSAEVPVSEDELLIEEMKEAYIRQWREDYKVSWEAEWFDGTLNYFCYLGEAGWHVFQAAAIPGSPVEPTDVIGDYRFTACMCMSYCDTNPSGTYAYKDGQLMTLKEAYNKGLVDLDLLYEKTDKTYVMTPLNEEEILENRCKAEFMEEYGIATEDENVTVCFAVELEHYVVFRAHNGSTEIKDVRQRYRDYWLYSKIQYGDEKNPFGMYTLDNYGNVEILGKVIDSGFVEMEELFHLLSGKWNIYMSGDVNNDQKLNIRDATLIQKYLVNLPEAIEVVENHPLGEFIMDYDYNSATTPDIDIKDATRIQKKLAGFFDYKERQPFEYDEILVFTSTEDEKVYTLEDFPEYEFESIKRGEYATYLYTLTLKHPGKDNVIEAINSLKYREDVDIEGVCANYLFYSD